MEVREYLHRKGLQWKEVKRPSGLTAVMPCISCGDKDSFAINLSDGSYSCLRKNNCGITGSYFNLQKYFGDEFSPIGQDRFIKTEKKYRKPEIKPKPVNQAAYDLFKSRKINAETIKHFKIGMTEKEIIFPYFKEGELVNCKYRNIAEKKFRREADCISTLFNQDNITENILYIVEGEFDCMALKEYGIEGVSIPSGVNDMGWIENDWNFLERFQTVVIIMDNDKAGQESVDKIVARLGNWRCMNALLPYKDVNDCLINGVSKADFVQHLINAKGFDIPQLTSCKDYIDEIIEYQKDHLKLYGIKTGFQGLTDIIKGWRMEEVSIWTGSNGSGKSTIINQEMLNLLSQGKRICIGSFEMPPRKYLRWMLMQALEKETFSEEDIRRVLNKYAEQLFIINIVGEIKQNDLTSIMEFASRKYGIEYFFIDSLMRISFDEKYELKEQKHFIAGLKAFASKYKSHIHVVAHPRKGANDDDMPDKSSIAGTGDITNLADNVFSFYRFSEEKKQEAFGKGKELPDNILFVKKNREHGNLGNVKLYFNASCKKFKEKEQETNFDKMNYIHN
jgi:twinkle protein